MGTAADLAKTISASHGKLAMCEALRRSLEARRAARSRDADLLLAAAIMLCARRG